MPQKMIGLVDVDGHLPFPNLALMKLSTWHKAQGDEVEHYSPIFRYDRVYMGKIFTYTPDKERTVLCNDIIKGGTGYGLDSVLPPEVDNIYPDYGLYGIEDTAYGYLTRGCPRNCEFCIVSQKEGLKTIQQYKLSQFWRGQRRIKLLDANLTAAPNCLELFKELAETRAYIDFVQGLDLRLMTEEKAVAVKRLKLKRIHFAWDKMEDEALMVKNLRIFLRVTGFRYDKICIYVLTNFNTTFEEDLHRIYTIRDLGANPYVMIHNKISANRVYRHLQRYVNARPIFRSIKNFGEYNAKFGLKSAIK